MEFELNGGVLLKTAEAFQHRFLILIFPRSYGTGTPLLAEPAAARQDFLAFLKFFLATVVASGIPTRKLPWKNVDRRNRGARFASSTMCNAKGKRGAAHAAPR